MLKPAAIEVSLPGGLVAAEQNLHWATAADLIYCMDRHQLDAVFRLEPNAAGRAQLLAGEGIEIPDPHFQNDEFFREVAARIERAVADRKQELLERISRSEGEDGPTAR